MRTMRTYEWTFRREAANGEETIIVLADDSNQAWSSAVEKGKGRSSMMRSLNLVSDRRVVVEIFDPEKEAGHDEHAVVFDEEQDT